jgi:hypothetical protein
MFMGAPFTGNGGSAGSRLAAGRLFWNAEWMSGAKKGVHAAEDCRQ